MMVAEAMEAMGKLPKCKRCYVVEREVSRKMQRLPTNKIHKPKSVYNRNRNKRLLHRRLERGRSL